MWRMFSEVGRSAAQPVEKAAAGAGFRFTDQTPATRNEGARHPSSTRPRSAQSAWTRYPPVAGRKWLPHRPTRPASHRAQFRVPVVPVPSRRSRRRRAGDPSFHCVQRWLPSVRPVAVGAAVLGELVGYAREPRRRAGRRRGGQISRQTEMAQDLLKCRPLRNRGQQPQAPAAVGAGQNVEVGVKRMENRKPETGNRKQETGNRSSRRFGTSALRRRTIDAGGPLRCPRGFCTVRPPREGPLAAQGPGPSSPQRRRAASTEFPGPAAGVSSMARSRWSLRAAKSDRRLELLESNSHCVDSPTDALRHGLPHSSPPKTCLSAATARQRASRPAYQAARRRW